MKPSQTTLLIGDCRDVLKTLPACSAQCCVTSPPYWGLRSYLPKDHPHKSREIGAEKTPEEFVANMVDVFREVRRVLRDDGVLWLNLGDTYASESKGSGGVGKSTLVGTPNDGNGQIFDPIKVDHGLKSKNLVGIPWRVAFALQADGWYLRQDIIWAKPNPMPESVTDRCTKAHEYIFLLAKSQRYFYDAEAIKEQDSGLQGGRQRAAAAGTFQYAVRDYKSTKVGRGNGGLESSEYTGTRNRRSVWTVSTKPYKGAHFATFPPDLIEPCILAGTSAEGCCANCGAPWERVVERGESFKAAQERFASNKKQDEGYKRNDGDSLGRMNGAIFVEHKRNNPDKTTGWQPTCTCNTTEKARCVVLDPFNGSGTTGEVARLAGCDYIGCELNDGYEKLARKRWEQKVLV